MLQVRPELHERVHLVIETRGENELFRDATEARWLSVVEMPLKRTAKSRHRNRPEALYLQLEILNRFGFHT